MNAVRPVEKVLLLGGTSEIGLAAVRALVRAGARTVVLAGRDAAALGAAAAGLRDAGAAHTEVVAFDAFETGSHRALVDATFDKHGDIDVAILAWGVLGEQASDERDADAAIAVLRANFEGAVSVGIPAAERLRAQGHGHLVLLSSVAAERPQRRNFVYGASKAGADAFFQGLGDSLEGTGVHVMVVRPGRVRTRMTAGMPDIPFTTDPEQVADDIVTGLRRRSHTVWSPPILRAVMFGMRHLPRPLFRRVGA